MQETVTKHGTLTSTGILRKSLGFGFFAIPIIQKIGKLASFAQN
jgi:hypothetical protein